MTMWVKFFAEGRLDAENANCVKDGLAEKFGFNKVVIDRKGSYILLSMEDEYMLGRVVDYISLCGLEVNSYRIVQ